MARAMYAADCVAARVFEETRGDHLAWWRAWSGTYGVELERLSQYEKQKLERAAASKSVLSPTRCFNRRTDR